MDHTPRKSIIERYGWWLTATLCCLAILGLCAPAQLPVLVYVQAKLAAYGLTGLFLDQIANPDQRPHMHPENTALTIAAGYRRAVIMAACLIGGGLGV